MDLEKKVQVFLKKTKKTKKPVLVGFSGGNDSFALVHALIHLKIPLELAHFDHSWRPTSHMEVEQLKKWATERNVAFHTKKSESTTRRELDARLERFAFFQTLFSSNCYEALVLAHHRDDQVETILKRVMEGTHLTTLKGMRSVCTIEAMAIWRPLLKVGKQEISDYNAYHSLQPIQDVTNDDPSYLRARMRRTLIPNLSKEFGKEVAPSLLRLAEYGNELEEYLSSKPFPRIDGPFGVMWEVSTAHPIEIRYHLGEFFRKKETMITEKVIDRILSAISLNLANHKVCFSNQVLIVDRKRLFWLKGDLPVFPGKRALKQGVMQNEGWHWEIGLKRGKGSSNQNWQDWWKGKISITIPKRPYELTLPCKRVRKRYNTCKIPAFLRDTLPVLQGEDSRDFLTNYPLQQEEGLLQQVEIEIKSIPSS